MERLTAGTTLGGGTAGGWGSLRVIYCASRLGLRVRGSGRAAALRFPVVYIHGYCALCIRVLYVLVLPCGDDPPFAIPCATCAIGTLRKVIQSGALHSHRIIN